MSDVNKSESVLARLRNEHMSAVTFVQDYVQLHFDGPCITAYVWPRIIRTDVTHEAGMAGYRDALCDLIGKTIIDVGEDSNKSLFIRFIDGATLEVSLNESDRDGPEAAMFQDETGNIWDTW